MEKRDYNEFADSLNRRTKRIEGSLDYMYEVLYKINQDEFTKFTDDMVLTTDQKFSLDLMVLKNLHGEQRRKLLSVMVTSMYDFGISYDAKQQAYRNGEPLSDQDITDYFDFIYEKVTGRPNENKKF